MMSFLSKLNARQIIIHFIACWLVIYAFHTLASLIDYTFLYSNNTDHYSIFYKPELDRDMSYLKIGDNVGLIIAYIIAWQISARYKWHWQNAVIVLVAAFVLSYFELLGWAVLKNVFLYPGGVIFAFKSKGSIIANAAIMIGLASILFFVKPINNFIDKGVKRDAKVPQPRPPKKAKKKV